VQRLVVTAFEVTVAVEVPDGFPLDSVLEGLPPDYRRRRPTTAADHAVTVTRDGPGFAVDPDGQPPHGPLTQAQALRVAQSGLELTVAEHAVDRYVVHAGAVAVDGRAIVLPGATMAGKSTLTLALVRAGAAYLSDEFAVFDGDGRVHPYARPIAMRHGPDRYVPVTRSHHRRAAELGLVADLRFDALAGWSVTPLTAAGRLLALLGQSATASTRPDATMDALARASLGAAGIGGTRGPADEAARTLLGLLGTASPNIPAAR
jgi:hypothetical protein